MFGQIKNRQLIDSWIINNKVPKFFIIQGSKGSGKKELANYFAEKMNLPKMYFEPNIDGVRDMITMAYTQNYPILMVLPDCDKLSIAGQNSLLKIIEEPPKNTYIIVTTNSDILLPTIKSRGNTILMEDYTVEELTEFAKDIKQDTDLDIKLQVVTNPGELLILSTQNFAAIRTCCENILNNISKANIGSTLKITSKLCLTEKDKDNKDLFDLSLFMNTLSYVFYNAYLNDKTQKYYKSFDIILHAKKLLSKNLNKQYILDNMLLKLREA